MKRIAQKYTPLVSVLMPVKNGEKFVTEAINSILSQTYGNFELLVIDDGSTDSTWKIISDIQKRNLQKMRVYKLPQSRGAYGAMNFVWNRMKGDLVAIMDSDDVAYPKRLERQVEFMINHPSVGVLGANVDVINGDGKLIGEKVLPRNNEQIYEAYGRYHPMVHPAVLMKKYLLDDSGGYFDRFGVNDDYFTLMTLLKSTEFANLPEKLLAYRVHGNNSSLRDFKKLIINTVKIRLTGRVEADYRISAKSWVVMIAQLIVAVMLSNKTLAFMHNLRWDMKKWKMKRQVGWSKIGLGISSVLLFWSTRNK